MSESISFRTITIKIYVSCKLKVQLRNSIHPMTDWLVWDGKWQICGIDCNYKGLFCKKSTKSVFFLRETSALEPSESST